MYYAVYFNPFTDEHEAMKIGKNTQLDIVTKIIKGNKYELDGVIGSFYCVQAASQQEALDKYYDTKM
jgi:hypothetical protein